MRYATILLIAFGLIAFAGCSRKPVPELVENTSTPSVTATREPTVSTVASATRTSAPQPSLTPTLKVILPPQPFLGIHVDRMDKAEKAELFRGSGAIWSRRDYAQWEKIEPVNSSPQDYNWDTVLEANLIAAVEDGHETIMNILFTPAWAQKYPGVACGPISEDALDDFAEFMAALVSRYSQPPYNVRYWEIGNEPDIDRTLVDSQSIYGCWGEKDDPYYGGKYYGEMLNIVYPAVKGADPESQLIVGGLVLDCDPVNPPEITKDSGQLRDCTSSKFLEGILEAGAGDSFDGVSFHAYDYYYGDLGVYGNEGWHSAATTTGPVLIAKSRFLKSLLTQYGFPQKELLNTELAVLCGKDGKEATCRDVDFTDTKANYIAQSNAAAHAEGLRVNMWYSLTGWRGSGLVDEGLEPLPAYQAYQFSATQLENAVPLGPVLEFEGIQGYRFQKENKTIWLIWSRDLVPHAINLPTQPQTIYNVYGQRVAGFEPPSLELTVTENPVYLEWYK